MKKSIYFNYAGVSQMPFQLLLNLSKFLAHHYFIGTRSALIKYEKYVPLLYQELATLLRCNSNEISYIKNTTEGIVIAAEALPLSSGDEILVMACEYPANLIPWLKKKKDGMVVKVIEGRNSAESFENLVNAISNKTKVIAVSWVQFFDGLMVDISKLSEICTRNKIFLVVDAVQVVGTRVIDLSKTKIDILVCGGHKHIMSVMGSGFIYVNKNTLPVLKDFKVGIRSVEKFDNEEFKLKPNSARFEDGTLNLLGAISLYYRVKSINKLHIENIEKRNLALLNHYKKELQDNHVSFIDYQEQGNLISIPVKNPVYLMSLLEAQKVYVKAINNQVLRISFSFLNTKKDIQRFIKVFRKYLKTAESL